MRKGERLEECGDALLFFLQNYFAARPFTITVPIVGDFPVGIGMSPVPLSP